MALKIGEQAPDFMLSGTSGVFSLSQDLPHEPCIIYFYPKDFSSGCTKEACEFRDHFTAFHNMGITIIGISQDNVRTHQRFKKKYSLPFALLSDVSGEVAESYKALMPILGVIKRVTYLLNKDHQIEAVFEDMFNTKKHIDNMIKKL